MINSEFNKAVLLEKQSGCEYTKIPSHKSIFNISRTSLSIIAVAPHTT